MNPARINKKYALLIAVSLPVVIGFIAGLFVSTGQQTASGCICFTGGPNNTIENLTGKNLCNTFDKKDYVFFTGVLNVYVEKAGKVGVHCDNGEKQGVARKVKERSGYKVDVLVPGARDSQ